jgi:hypothetical protein
MHDSATLETRGVPTVPIITATFVEEAHAQRAALGMPELDPAVIEHPLSTLTDEQIDARARSAVGQVRSILVAG